MPITLREPSTVGEGEAAVKYVSATMRFAITGLLAYLTYVLAVQYRPDDPLGYRAPVLLFVLDTINLFIHEAGHLFCRMLGETMYVLGGSLVQCLLPLALVIGTWRNHVRHVGVPLFWFGENLVNVSVYIADAPHKNLKLIKGGLVHDWNWLLEEHLDVAEPLGLIVRWSGLVACVCSIAVMLYHTTESLRKSATSTAG